VNKYFVSYLTTVYHFTHFKKYCFRIFHEDIHRQAKVMAFREK